MRAKIILLASGKKENKQIAKELGITQEGVEKWRKRFSQQGIQGLKDRDQEKPKEFNHKVKLKLI